MRISNALSGGKASGGATAACTTSGADTSTPTVLQSCDIPTLFGRYVTIQGNRSTLRFHGLEV